MRIYTTCQEAVKETERELWEMGIEVRGSSMQDKNVEGDEDYFTKEVTAYGFQITNPPGDPDSFIHYLFPDDAERLLKWCYKELQERISANHVNPGEAWLVRSEVWGEFFHGGRFQYTYNERIRPQINRIIEELHQKPGTRQAIIEIHNNLIDIHSLGGGARVPCSMHYQFLIRNEKLDMIYIMRSSDLLTHFAMDNWLAINLQIHIANALGIKVGRYTFFTGSLHAYRKDMAKRGIF